MTNIPKIVTRVDAKKFPLEKKVEARLRTKIIKLGGECYKFSSLQNRGVFDRIVILEGFVCFVEVKAEKGKPSKHQQKFAEKMEKHSAFYCFVYGFSGVDEFIRDVVECNPIKHSYNEPKRRKKC